MAGFAVRRLHGPSWDATRGVREQRDWDAHATFMDGLVENGFVVLGGPVPDGALLLVEARDEREIRSRLSHDPWVRSGLLTTGRIEAWQIWLDARRMDT